MKDTATLHAYPLLASSLLLALCLAILPEAGHAQGCSLQPTQIELTDRPGGVLEQELSVRSAKANGTTSLTLGTTVLGQDARGAICEVDPKNLEQALAQQKSRSCAEWITLSTAAVVLEPQQAKSVTVRVKIPSSARGFYYAGVVATETVPGTGQLAVNMIFRFVALVLVTVQGPPARRMVALTGTEMKMVPAMPKQPASTSVALAVANQGETFAGVRGTVTVSYLAGDKWRRLTEAAIKDLGVFPGVAISPSADLRRALPAGRYRLYGQLYVDDRPGGTVETEVDYAGDPTATTVTADVNLSVKPVEVTINARPGSARAVGFTVQNLSDETVGLTARLQVPDALRPKEMTDTRGAAFDCTRWLSLRPDSLELRPKGRAGLQIVCALPQDVVAPPHTYGQLVLEWTYPNGARAGSLIIPVTVNVAGSAIAEEFGAKAEQVELALQTGSTYVVTARFANTGNVDFAPTATATVQTGLATAALSKPLETAATRLLPLGLVQFSGELDFAKVAAGTYALAVTMAYGGKSGAVAQLSLQVEDKDGQKLVSVIETPAAPEAPTAAAAGQGAQPPAEGPK